MYITSEDDHDMTRCCSNKSDNSSRGFERRWRRPVTETMLVLLVMPLPR